jgi:hypothetical protein
MVPWVGLIDATNEDATNEVEESRLPAPGRSHNHRKALARNVKGDALIADTSTSPAS